MGNSGGHSRSRSQAAMEYLVILAVSFMVIASLVSIVSSQSSEMIKVSDESNARLAASKIGSAAREVFAKGKGSRNIVTYSLPDSYDPADSYIANDTLVLHVGSSDFSYSTGVELHGSLPDNPGYGILTVENMGSYVSIGNDSLALSKSQLSFFISLGGNESLQIDVTNNYPSTANVTVALPDLSPDAVLSASPAFATVGTGQVATFTVGAKSTGASGSFIGDAGIHAEYPGFFDDRILPISVDVAQGVACINQSNTTIIVYSNTTPFSLSPSTYNVSLHAGENSSLNFSICAPSAYSLPNVTFGIYGNGSTWFSNLSPISAIPNGSCKFLQPFLSVPPYSALAGYSDALLAFAGNETDGSLVNLQIMPVGLDFGNINYTPYPAWRHYNETISANVLSNSQYVNITNCSISLDGGLQLPMGAADGAYNSWNETAKYYLYNLSAGPHQLNITCRDTDNLSNSTIATITSYSSLAIVAHINPANQNGDDDEAMWFTWMTTHNGTITNWSIEIINYSQILSGNRSLDYFKTLALASYDPGFNLNGIIRQFTNTNRTALLLSNGILVAPWDMGFATGNGSGIDPANYLYISDNTSYITSPFKIGNLKVGTGSNQQGSTLKIHYSGTGLNATRLADDESGTTRQVNETSLWVHGNLFGLGFDNFDNPTFLNANGTNLTTRLIDYAINSSHISGVG